jgi:hypothetical protein
VAKKAPKGYFYNARGLLVKKLDEATIKAIKDRFPDKSFDFNKFKYGVPDSDPIHDQLRNMNPERKAVIRKRRSKEDYKAKRRLEESDYYERNREKILQNLKEKYRSDKTVGKTGKTLKELIKERNIAALIKKENTQGIFPTGYTTGKNRIGFYKPELALWRDLYRSSQMPGQTRWSLPKKFVDNLPTNELGKKAWGQNNYYKKIKFTDNNTGETIKLDDTIKGKGKTLKEYLNTTIAKETGNKKVFEKATNTYDLKNNLKDVEIKYKGDTQRIGNILRTVASDKTDSNILSVFEVHHPSGVKNNWWDSEVVFRDANRNLNFIDKKLQRDYKTATTATQKNKLLKDAAKEVDKLPGGITYFFDGERVGVKSPTEESVLKAAASTYKDPALTRAINILVNKTKSVRGGCTAVVTAALGGPIDTCEAVIRANPKAAAMKLNNAITATKGPLKDLKEDSQKLIRLYRGESFPQRNIEGFKSKAKFFDTTIPEIKKDTLSGQWFTPTQDHARSYLARPGRMKYVDVTPQELESFNKYKERVNKRPVKYSVRKMQGLADPPTHSVTESFHHQLIPRYKLKQMEEAGRIKTKYDLNPFGARNIGDAPLVKPTAGVLEYNRDLGKFLDPNDPTKLITQEELKMWGQANPEKVTAGTEAVEAATNKSVLSNVAKSLARVGAPLPVAAIDSYFIGKQVAEGKGTAEIASNPLNWLGLATMEPLAKASGIAQPGKLNAILRLGLNPATIRGITRFAGLPGLAISTAMTAYDQYQKYKDGEGFIFNLLNQKGTE